MILIGQFDSPFVRRVAVTLHCYDIAYTRQPWSVFSNMKEMRGVNPLVRVPALILDSGETLIDSGAIIDHLDELAGPDCALTPRTGIARRQVLQTVALATGAMEKTMKTFLERYFHNQETISRDYEGRMLGQLSGALDHLEMQCGTMWFDGQKMTQGDVSITCLIGYLKTRLPDAWRPLIYPKLTALADHCETLEVFIKARASADEGIPARS